MNLSDNQETDKDPGEFFLPSPLSLFVASVAVIFIAEALVMLIIHSLGLPESFFIGIIDAALLSLFVVPTLYFMLFKPMRNTIARLDKSEEIQKKLKETDQLKSDFISIAAHELCTPVSTITGYVDLLIDTAQGDHQKEYLGIIQEKAAALGRIIDDLHVVDNLDDGENLQIYKEENDLVKTVTHVVNVYQMRLQEKPIILERPSESVIMKFDAQRISQVLDNLLSNAIKYDNSIHNVIDVSITEHNNHVDIIVRDEGIGMSEDELKKIYNKFFRAQTEKSVVGGLGLGMAIVKNIVEGHDGTIGIISQRKVGTTVTVSLPKA